jgi:hypothetical protein
MISYIMEISGNTIINMLIISVTTVVVETHNILSIA